jgi:hypothetical protein
LTSNNGTEVAPPEGVIARVMQRILALTTAIGRTDATDATEQTVLRSLRAGPGKRRGGEGAYEVARRRGMAAGRCAGKARLRAERKLNGRAAAPWRGIRRRRHPARAAPSDLTL